MRKLYAISGVTGMTGNELVRQILTDDSDDHIILQPNEPATVSFSATGTCSVKIYARGMYD